MSILWIVLLLLISIAVAWGLERLFGRGETLDRGLVLCFWKLSDRRKLFRTLWMLPVGVLALTCFHWAFASWWLTGVAGGLLLLVFIVQAVWYYKKWKETE